MERLVRVGPNKWIAGLSRPALKGAYPATSLGISVGKVIFADPYRTLSGLSDYVGMLKHDVPHVASWGTGLLTLCRFSLAAANAVLNAFHRIFLENGDKMSRNPSYE